MNGDPELEEYTCNRCGQLAQAADQSRYGPNCPKCGHPVNKPVEAENE